MPVKLKSLISIAGSDPVGGAGIQADIRAGNLLGLHVFTAITAVTAQNSKGIFDLGILPSTLLKKQLKAISEDIFPDAIKIGMIGCVDNLKVIIDYLLFLKKENPLIPIVVDPVLASTSGNILLHPVTSTDVIIKGYIDSLFPLATVVTPNLNEFRVIYGESYNDDIDSDDYLNHFGSNAIIIKGGHGEGSDVRDILIQKNQKIISRHPRVVTKNLHGSGCVFSSILASFLAKGETLDNAFKSTSALLYKIINKSVDYNMGNSSYGPLNVFNYEYTL